MYFASAPTAAQIAVTIGVDLGSTRTGSAILVTRPFTLVAVVHIPQAASASAALPMRKRKLST